MSQDHDAEMQVAVLLKHHEENCQIPQPCKFIETFPTAARALLDRLQRAEAVVEAVKKHTWIGEGSREIEEALAAWEEGK